MMAQSPNKSKIDLSALAWNLQAVRDQVSPGTKIMAVVKSDAYGHGLIPVAKSLEGRGVDALGVAYLEEGLELRRNAVRCPIVLLCGIRTRTEAEETVQGNLTPVLHDLEAAEHLEAECSKRGRRLGIHLKVDTGMGRLGMAGEHIENVFRKASGFRRLETIGLTSHLSSADDPSTEFTDLQIDRFKAAISAGRAMGLTLPCNTLANSAGVMRHKGSHFEMVRPGIMLYGGLPSPDFGQAPPLRPVMHLQGEVLQVRDLPDRTPVSYGRTCYTQGEMKTAVLSAGYGDGIPRKISNVGSVLIRGRRCRILGTVCMNMVVCDVTGLPECAPGDEAVFLGSQGEEVITGDQIARWAGTISYEIFCSIGPRHTKEYFS